MKVDIKITAAEQRRLRKQVQEMAKVLGKRSGHILDEVAQDIRSGAINILRSQKTNNTGRLGNSITIQKTRFGARRVATDTGYGLYVEFGRPPGKWPPRNRLERWAKRKLGLSGKEAKNAAFLIARKIGKEGTKAQPFLRPAYQRERVNFARKFRKLVR